MTTSKCDLTNPKFTYQYCPSYAAAVLFAVLFSFTTAGHVYQAVRLRKPFAAILIMGGFWEILGYIIRTISIRSPFAEGLNTAQMLFILLAPLWINAFIYMLIGRMIHFFFDDDRIFGIKARKITLIFVVFDFTAFMVQGAGGSISSSDNMDTALTGLNIYTVGVALQIAFNVFFLAIVGRFHRKALLILRDQAQLYSRSFGDCMHLLRITYVVLGLILLRNFYRLAEFSSGLDNSILKHEWYTYVFDAVPMFAAFIILNIWHPGQKLQGARCDFTEENKAVKQAKKERKEAKKKGAVVGEKVNIEDLNKGPVVTSQQASDSVSV